MEHVVTFETAKALKDAGFPQPYPQKHQFWYIGGDLYIFLGKRDDGIWIVFDFEYHEVTSVAPTNVFFAPGLADVLTELGDGFAACWFNGGWETIEPFALEPKWYSRHDFNPAESAAAAYIQSKAVPA